MLFRHALKSIELSVSTLRCLAGSFLALLAFHSGGATADARLQVVTSFSILGDMVARVGGERVNVVNLIGPGGDAHVYQPTPADAKTLGQAGLVVVNGLGFEGWIDRLIKSSAYRGKVVRASQGVKTLELPSGKHDKHEKHDHHGKHSHGPADPHAWQDMANAARYVDNIARGLTEADPAGKAIYAENAARYKEALAVLDKDLKARFQRIPAERRKVVAAHDAFAYFTRAYGVRFIAPAGVSKQSEPSAADLGRVIQQIRREKIPAIFVESVADVRLAERISQESGARVGGTLYSDALSAADGPAATYLMMMRHNGETLLKALAEE